MADDTDRKPEAPDAPRWKIEWSPVTIATVASIAIVVLLYAIMAFRRRWISDDGLIVIRVAAQLLEGNGPVFNSFERSEPNTSTLWTYIVAAIGWVSGAGLSYVAVYAGWVLAVLSLVIGIDGTRRFHRARGVTVPLVPAGALVVVGVYAFWDYATSGLETGLCWCWIAVSWWLLATLTSDAAKRRQIITAVVFGLGPLVRPDFALVSAVFLGAIWLILRPPWRRTLLLVGAAGGLPFAYEIFRMGYYGMLVPLPALAKGASGSAWDRGFAYVRDFSHPYMLHIPLAVMLGVLGYVIARRVIAGRDRIVILAPVIAGVLLTLFVARVGGDFMHGRMMLGPTLLLLLPAMVLPLRALTAPVLVVLTAWALIIGIWRNDNRNHCTSPVVNDERIGYRLFTGHKNPVDSSLFVRAMQPISAMVHDAVTSGKPMLITEGGVAMPINTAHTTPVAFVVGRLGTGGAVAPLDAIVVDTLGLANPLGARITVTNPGITGHEKPLPWAWVLADFTAPGTEPFGATPEALAAARRALTCGEIAELLASVRDPMTVGRFWANLTGSVSRTRLVIPSNPIDAEKKFCR